MKTVRFTVLVILVMSCAVASANGAMGLAFEIWDYKYWFAYVAAMVGLEALLIGRWLKVSWTKSVLTSIVANAVTGMLCGMGGSMTCAPLLHTNTPDPRPFWFALILLTIFAVPSAWIEWFVWRHMTIPKDRSALLRWTVVVHLILVPVGLAILLIPDRPYIGFEATAHINRYYRFRSAERALEYFIGTNNTLPKSTDIKGLIREIDAYSYYHGNDFAIGFYRPEISRFSTGESWEHPSVTINTDIAGKRIYLSSFEPEQWVWYLHSDYRTQNGHWGIAVDLNSGQVEVTDVLPPKYRH